ncbi:hypothetical protein BDDG_05621 [Blastomyces dermatitidis ATCC 18188]|uniref:Ubiquitin 3 binding protein But2 C-terminal domain-containing protein n=1 Tax=Ajellomyces dermatitidis (strain ATCC 18188 / CBS 674.68) TaxID=653446 RepID=F2THG4_AJEDA|nr:hypothetical protein BDDG_05621 [Blastomyces dermatitidis ATCC 18188]EQL34538.1 hypothetical protein BDFG_03680 [Blastomyces dermatitidis ATCC 26199]
MCMPDASGQNTLMDSHWAPMPISCFLRAFKRLEIHLLVAIIVIPGSLASCLALLSLLGAAIAAPSPAADLAHGTTAELALQGCQTIAPTTFDLLDINNPDLPIEFDWFFTVARRDGVNTRITAFTFEGIPAGATGCMLAFDSPKPTSEGQYGYGPSVTVDIWSTQPWTIPHSPTYSKQPPRDQLVATLNVPISEEQEAFHTILASNTCSHTMSFLAEYSPWQKGDGMAFWLNQPGTVGFSMVFNC